MPGSRKPGGHFFDTNVLLYLLSADAAKADRAEALLAEGGTVSVQVLNEFVSVARRKLDMAWADIAEVLGDIRSIVRTEPLTEAVHDQAVVLARDHRLAWYDALIAASAMSAGCKTLCSEDFQDGALLGGSVRVLNPFLVRA